MHSDEHEQTAKMKVPGRNSESPFEELRRLLSQPVSPEAWPRAIVSAWKEEERRNLRLARRYSKWVWPEIDIDAYIAEQAMECAKLVLSKISHERLEPCSYLLANIKGVRTVAMGQVKISPLVLAPEFDLPGFRIPRTELDPRSTVVITNVELHPSLRRKGFLTTMKRHLCKGGVENMVLASVNNPSWAYDLFRKSQTSDAVKLICLSPFGESQNAYLGRTFSVRLGQVQGGCRQSK